MYGLNKHAGNDAQELFDRYGRLRQDHYQHEINKGTAVWGTELDHSHILLFQKYDAHQEREQGANLVKAILGKAAAHSPSGFFAFVNPLSLLLPVDLPFGASTSDPKYIGRNFRHDNARLKAIESFWRSLGFRRVGRSLLFAYADSPTQTPQFMRKICMGLCDKLKDDKACLAQLVIDMPANPQDPSWSYISPTGNSILHLAASGCKPACIEYIVSIKPELLNMRNRNGYTPRETLQNTMDFCRETGCIYGTPDDIKSLSG
ncbi:hypothetical protein B0T17DRAFT_504423 [Bombardia bombarda]|uniref:Uncharacterized protein n=1 Tax=Bombardia bombarda TaxID=252184 RepID=A0AA40CFM7_9PEZI|nr:hypothetical protein B0T17DRAFT_504423 [Bombardia bombarda]